MVRKVLGLAGLIALYYGIYRIFPVRSFFPSPQELAGSIVSAFSDTGFYGHILSSLQRVLVGFTAAGIAGIVLGLSIGSAPKLRWLRSYVELLRPIPPIAWIPIAILLFGLGNMSAYFIVFIGAFFPIFTNTYFGVVSMPRIYRNVALSFEMNPITYASRILFSYSLPYIFTGLKIGVGMAWMSVIAAELIATSSGLGYYIQLNRLLLRTDNVLIGMMTIGLIGYGLNRAIEALETFVIRWK